MEKMYRDLLIFKDETASRFSGIDQKFSSIDQSFTSIDQRFDSVDQKFTSIDQRFDSIDQRFDALEKKVDKIDQNQIRMENEFTEKIRGLYDAREVMVEQLNRIEDKVGRHEEFIIKRIK